MGDKATFAVQVDKDSELYAEFEQYKQRGGFESTSETLRHLMRAEFDDERPSGFVAALWRVAGDRLKDQVGLLGRYLLYTGVALLLLDVGVFAAPVWVGMAAVFGFLSLATALAVSLQVAGHLAPDEKTAPSSGSTGDEVEA